MEEGEALRALPGFSGSMCAGHDEPPNARTPEPPNAVSFR